mmetsp:Transcript_3782/g.8328  ORF Transcript_3782/g.8328 Transcript_3782/m.8328 type:complete len:108 (+) Transcript_3782:49-372(+)
MNSGRYLQHLLQSQSTTCISLNFCKLSFEWLALPLIRTCYRSDSRDEIQTSLPCRLGVLIKLPPSSPPLAGGVATTLSVAGEPGSLGSRPPSDDDEAASSRFNYLHR